MQGKRRSELLHKLLALYPPVLHRWFLARIPEPASWHRARLAFTRTTAVWSMVGHIVGLGDRHGENILLDATTGDCVHVDFAFLFDRVGAFVLAVGLKLSPCGLCAFCCSAVVCLCFMGSSCWTLAAACLSVDLAFLSDCLVVVVSSWAL